MPDYGQYLTSIQAECRAVSDFDATGESQIIFLAPKRVVQAAERLLHHGFYIEDIMGLEVEEGMLAVYHFAHFDKPGRLTLRVLAEQTPSGPTVPSIASVYQGAEWHERETADFHGIVFTGNPNPKPLLLGEEIEGPPPLLKSDKAKVSLRSVMPYHTLIECVPNHPLAELADEAEDAETTATESTGGEA